MLRVGLTGGIASGKSTVARLLAASGCHVIDADRIVGDLYAPGASGYEKIRERYGDEVLTRDGEIDRARLAALALSSPEGAAELNALIHPLVIAETEKRLQAIESATGGRGIAVVEAALLLESGGRDRYDWIVVVDVPAEEQMLRGVDRGMDPQDLRRRISRQMSRKDRAALADTVIDNRGDLATLAASVERLMAELKRIEKLKN